MIVAWCLLGALSADRPTVTEGASTVPAGAVQVEAGFEYARQSPPISARPVFGAAPPDVDSVAFPLEIRVGVLDTVELHFEGVAYTRVDDGNSVDGFPDFELGGKATLYRDEIFTIGASGGVTLPLGVGDVASDGDVLLAAAGLVDCALTDEITLSVNAGFEQLFGDEGSASRLPLGAALSIALGNFGVFVDAARSAELAGDDRLLSTNNFGLGGTYLLTDTVLLDAFVRSVSTAALEGVVAGGGVAATF